MACVDADFIGPKNAPYVTINKVRWPIYSWEVANKAYVDAQTGSHLSYIYPLGTVSDITNTDIIVNNAVGTLPGVISGVAQTLGGALTLTAPLIGAAITATGQLSGASASVGSSTPAVITTSGALQVANNTASLSTSTGCATLAGGLGVAGDVHTGGNIYVGSSIFAPSGSGLYTDTGFNFIFRPDAITSNYWSVFANTTGGSGSIFQVHNTSTSTNGPNVEVPPTTQSTSTSTGALTIGGGLGLGGNMNSGGTVTCVGLSTGPLTAAAMTATSVNVTTTTPSSATSVIASNYLTTVMDNVTFTSPLHSNGTLPMSVTIDNASGTLPGVISGGSQTLGGNITFTNPIVAPNLPSSYTFITPLGTTAGSGTTDIIINNANGTLPGAISGSSQTLGGSIDFTGGVTVANPITVQAQWNSTINLDFCGTGSLAPYATTTGISIAGGQLQVSGTGTATYATNYNSDPGGQMTVRFLFTPTATNQTFYFFSLGSNVNVLSLYISLGNNVGLTVEDNTGSVLYIGSFYNWSTMVANTQYELEFDMDCVNAASRFFINGVQAGSTLNFTGTRNYTTPLTIGGQVAGGNSPNFKLSKFLIFRGVQHTSNYTPVLATTSLGSPYGILLNSLFLSTVTTNATSTSTGCMILSGGLGVANDIYCNNIYASNIPYYYSTSFTTQMTGPWGSSNIPASPDTVTLQKIGNIVVLNYLSPTGSNQTVSGAATDTITMTTNIPTGYIPTRYPGQFVSSFIYSNSNVVLAYVQILNPNGAWSIHLAPDSNFTALSGVPPGGFTITYSIL
jgi:hypothetical protein